MLVPIAVIQPDEPNSVSEGRLLTLSRRSPTTGWRLRIHDDLNCDNPSQERSDDQFVGEHAGDLLIPFARSARLPHEFSHIPSLGNQT
jgi:hypothetical protein